MQIGSQAVEKELTIDDTKPFVSKQDVPAGDNETWAYSIEGPDGYLIGIPAGVTIAPELRDADGNKLDGSTRITLQAADKQGNRLGGGIVFTDLISSFNYTDMRTDPDYFRKTQNAIMLDERELLRLFVDIPAGSPGMDAANSRLIIGDDTSDYGKAVEIVDKDDLNQTQQQAVAKRSTR